MKGRSRKTGLSRSSRRVHRSRHRKLVATIATVLGTAVAVPLTSIPSARAESSTTLTGNTASELLSQSTENGPADPGAVMNLSIVLKTHPDHGQTLAQFVQATETPGNPQFHHFLTPAQFKDRFAPTDAQVEQIVSFLQNHGFTVTNVFSNNLVIQASASIGTVEQLFNVTINRYQHGKKTFLANNQDPQFPSNLASLILGFAGLTTFANFGTHMCNRSSVQSAQPASVSGTEAPTPGPGSYGPDQVRSFYHLTPLYEQHATGSGQTIAIATLANFLPSDVLTYWQAYGVPSSPSRITVVPVDGGFPDGVYQPGAEETTLDVQQAGAMAPGANILVYEAPNTSQGFIDLFYSVVADGKASTMSVSWGEPEEDETPNYHLMLEQAFLAGAAEGISMFAASGDNGAYDNGTPNLAVDSPASDPYITAAGGTTYPADLGFTTIPTEQAWGWDYLLPYYAYFGMKDEEQLKKVVFPVGSGGGISEVWSTPWYQYGVSGASRSGRNVPDISLNADPFTGYTEYVTFGSGNNGWQTGWGGTSFVAPQLAGITAVIDSYLGKRVGFLNPLLYSLARQPNAYGDKTSPFYDITAGDNWYYHAVPGYDNATGIGSLDIANLANALAQMK